MSDLVPNLRERFFGDRGAWLRAGAVLAALAGFIAYAEMAWEYTRPALRRCLAEPARHHGKRVWMGPVRVERVEPTGFAVRDIEGHEVLVEAPAETAAAGEQVALRGTFLRPDPAAGLPCRVVLDLGNDPPPLRRTPGGMERRVRMFILSAGVLLIVAFRCVRTFRISAWRVTMKSS
jgi:hypothetical protein